METAQHFIQQVFQLTGLIPEDIPCHDLYRPVTDDMAVIKSVHGTLFLFGVIVDEYRRTVGTKAVLVGRHDGILQARQAATGILGVTREDVRTACNLPAVMAAARRGRDGWTKEISRFLWETYEVACVYARDLRLADGDKATRYWARQDYKVRLAFVRLPGETED